MKKTYHTVRWTPAIPAAVLLLALFSFGFISDEGDSDYFLKMYRGIDTYGKVYKEIAINYVDTLDPEECMRAGIDGMLKSLDPYTIYIGEKESDELDLITTGTYGGIGVTIGQRDGMITIISLMEGFSAAKQGIHVGDRILEVEGKNVKKGSLEAVRQLVRGLPGTELKMKIEREGQKKPIDFVLLREEIRVRNIAYSGFAQKSIGYIRLERFTKTAGEDLRVAIRDLLSRGELKGLVLDLRDNPGGLLESAVEVVSKFVPEKSLIVSTRGRKSDSERKYVSTETPILRDIPLAVLVNHSSASASEIVGGALQDLDRGVVVGTRTFGKGLVQTVIRFSEKSSLKMTTAKYYTPSGRCIQEIDYGHRDGEGNGTTVPDSLRKEFRTSRNRRVWESGGILPDTIVADSVRSPYFEELHRKAMFFQFANRFAAEHKTVSDSFLVSADLIKSFDTFLKEKGFEYQEEGESQLQELRTLASKGQYDTSFFAGIGTLEAILKTEKTRRIHRFQDEIRAALTAEIMTRMKGEKARFESLFGYDKQLQTALRILQEKRIYNKFLEVRGK